MAWCFGRRSAAALLTLLLAGPAVTQPRTVLPLLDRLQPGLWEFSGTGGEIAPICLGDPMQLTQLQHRDGGCSRERLSGDERSATFRYACRGIGFGRTTIRYETPRLVQIDSQGVDRGLPFALRMEARRTGACPGTTLRSEPRPTAR